MPEIKIDLLAETIDGRTNAFIDGLTERILEEVKEATPVVTGTLRDGWEVVDDGDSVAIVNKVPYAAPVNERHGMIDAGVSRIPSAVRELENPS